MRRLGTLSLELAVAAGLSLTPMVVAADPNADDPIAVKEQDKKSNNLFRKLFGSDDSKATRKQGVEADKNPEAAPPKESAVDRATAQRARDEANLLRRLAVCDQLRIIATQNKDDALLRQADQLQHQAEAVYAQRTTILPPRSGAEDSDENALSKHAGKETASSGSLSKLSPLTKDNPSISRTAREE